MNVRFVKQWPCRLLLCICLETPLKNKVDAGIIIIIITLSKRIFLEISFGVQAEISVKIYS